MISSFVQRLGQRNPDCIFEKIDPRCKLIILLIVTALIIFGDSIICASIFTAAGITAYFSKILKLYIFTGIFSALLWLVFIVIFEYVINKHINDPKSMFVGMVFRGTSLTTTGLWFAMTTKLRDTTIALKLWYVPGIIILPLTIAVRFIPTLLNESMIIRDSMKLRGIANRKMDLFKNPHLIGNSFITLSAIRSLKMADELAAVAETRGLAHPNIAMQSKKLKRIDYFALGITIILAIISISLSLIAGYLC